MNPWQELGLDESATPDEIRRAYRRKAAEHHPDRHPGDEQAAARFQRVRAAYDMLKDPPPRQAGPWHEPAAEGVGGAWVPPDFTPGVRVRFVSPEQLQPLLKRLRRVALLVVVGGLTGLVALGHALRGLPWAELAWPHQVVLSLGTGVGVAFVSFFAWLLAVFGLGFRWGTVAFWALVLVQLAR